MARLGQQAGLISCVGDDDFGWLNIERLRRDGVDTSAVRVDPDHVTGSAFVRYRPDGDRTDKVIAGRAVRLAARSEAAGVGLAARPGYVIGTEVPTPGGAAGSLDHLRPTTPEAVLATYGVHEQAFHQAAPAAWSRVLAIVVQPPCRAPCGRCLAWCSRPTPPTTSPSRPCGGWSWMDFPS